MTCALVLGSADGVWADVKALEEIIGHPWTGPVVACNDAGAFWPGPLAEWVSYHPVNFHAEKNWVARRKSLGHPDGFRTWTASGFEEGPVDMVLGADEVMRTGKSAGSSGLLSAQVAIKLYGRCVLAGIPLDRRPHFRGATPDGPFKTQNREYDQRRIQKFRDAWTQNSHILQPNLRSMSGWTMELFGLPTPEWNL